MTLKKFRQSEEQIQSSLCSFSVEDNRPEVVPNITSENSEPVMSQTCSRPVVLQRGFNSIHGCNGGDGENFIRHLFKINLNTEYNLQICVIRKFT